MESLVRVRSGAFLLDGAVKLEDVARTPDPRLRLRRAGSGLPFRPMDLPDVDLPRFLRGGEVAVGRDEPPGLVSVTRGHWLLAIGEVMRRDGGASAVPRKILEPEWKELCKILDK